MNPAISQAISKALPRSSATLTVNGVIEKSSDNNQVIIKTASGTIPVSVDSSRFSAGDPVVLTLQNGAFRLEKSGVKIDNIEIDKDIFLKSTSSTVRIADILEYIKQSVASGDSLLISESVKTALNLINDRSEQSGIDKTLITATLKAISMRLEQSGTLSNDAIDSLQKLKNLLQALSMIRPEQELPAFNLTNATALKNGIHLMTLDTLTSLIDKNSNNLQVKKLLDQFSGGQGTIAVRVSGDTGKKIIAPIPDSSLQRTFQSIITGMKSSLLQSLPIESLDILLKQRGSVDIDILTKLDNNLVTISSRFPQERAGSRSAAIAVISNWLSQSIDNIDTVAQPLKYPPALPQSLQKDIELIDTTLHNSTKASVAKLTGAGITETMLAQESRPYALPLSFNKLGLNTESSLLQNVTVTPTIKTELLKLLSGNIDNNVFQQQRPLSDQIVRTAIMGINNLIDSIDNSELLTDNHLKNGINRLTILKEQLPGFVPSITSQILTDNIDKVIKLLAEFKGSSSELVPLLKNITATLYEQLNSVLPETADASTLQKEKMQAEQFSQSGLNQASAETLLKIRGTVESAINKLESLQLLARQTPLADGSQQQILALPMKIGNEWTELNIRFLKKESSQKRKKANGSSFNVQISIAPENLGAVSVKMDYIVKKSLKISMDFEKDTTRIFFQKHNAVIKNAIAELGLPIFSVDIKKATGKSDAHDEKILEQLIDVKV